MEVNNLGWIMRKEGMGISLNSRENSAKSVIASESTYPINVLINKTSNKTKFGTKKSKLGLKTKCEFGSKTGSSSIKFLERGI